MGHLDGRIGDGKNPAPEAAGGAIDGATGMETKQAPDKQDGAEQALEKAPDVVHGGDEHGKKTPKSGA